MVQALIPETSFLLSLFKSLTAPFTKAYIVHPEKQSFIKTFTTLRILSSPKILYEVKLQLHMLLYLFAY